MFLYVEVIVYSINVFGCIYVCYCIVYLCNYDVDSM